MKTYIYQTFNASGITCECEETFVKSISRPHRKWQMTPCVRNEVGKIVPIAPVLYEGSDIEEILVHLKSGGYFRFTEVKGEPDEFESMFGFTPCTFDVIAFEIM